MNIIRAVIRKISGLCVPQEVICQPQKYRLKIWIHGDSIHVSFLLVGEDSIRDARMFISHVTKDTREWWIGEEIVIRCSDISMVTLTEEK